VQIRDRANKKPLIALSIIPKPAPPARAWWTSLAELVCQTKNANKCSRGGQLQMLIRKPLPDLRMNNTDRTGSIKMSGSNKKHVTDGFEGERK
jgi:hypothetical protein